MATEARVEEYVILEPVLRGGMLLAPLRDAPNEQSWTVGVRFDPAPAEPVVVRIRDGYEDAEPRPFLGVPPIVSEAMVRVLRDAGVDNLDVYDAVLTSRDGSARISGYKAFNLVGLVAAADLARTRFSPANPSRHLDASIEHLVVDGSRVGGLRMFRLAEHTSAVVVHRSVRAAIEAAGIGPVRFVEPSAYVS